MGHQNFSQDRARSAATCRGRPALELDARGIFQNSRKAQISIRIEAVKLDYTSRFVRVIHCAGASLLRATQQARLPLNQGTALVEPSLSSELSG